MVARNKTAFKRRGKKLYAPAMDLKNIREACRHTGRCLLVILCILAVLFHVLITGSDCEVYIAIWHLRCHERTHTGDKIGYCMCVYCTVVTPGKKHMSPHTRLFVAGDMPFICTVCDSDNNVRFVLKGRNKIAFYHIKLLTSWDYSLISIYLHNADKKY